MKRCPNPVGLLRAIVFFCVGPFDGLMISKSGLPSNAGRAEEGAVISGGETKGLTVFLEKIMVAKFDTCDV